MFQVLAKPVAIDKLYIRIDKALSDGAGNAALKIVAVDALDGTNAPACGCNEGFVCSGCII